jgi:hypothetical protein
VRGVRGKTGKLEPLRRWLAEARAGEGAGEDGDQRDPALRRRQEPPGISGEVDRALRAAAAAPGHCLEPCLARRNDRELAHRQDAVHRDQGEDQEKVEPGYGG